MSQVTLIFSDGHETVVDFGVEDRTEEEAQAAMNTVIESYIQANPGVKLTGKQFIGDKVEEKEDDKSEEKSVSEMTEEEKEAFMKENAEDDILARSQKYLAEKVLTYYGLKYISNKETQEENEEYYKTLSDAEVYGIAYKLPKEELIEFLDRFDLESSLLYMMSKGMEFDTALDELDEEKFLNVMGHRGLFATFNEDTKRYQVVVHLRDGLVVLYGTSKAAVVARALVVRATGQFYNNVQWLDEMVDYWKEINETNEDPRYPSKAVLNDIAKQCGTSIEEIEEHYKQQLNQAHQDVTLH